MNEKKMHQRDIFDTQISIFQVHPYISKGEIKTKWESHHVRTIGQYLNAAKTHYAATIDQTRSIMQSAVEAWEQGDAKAYETLMQHYKFNKWLPPVALMQGVNPEHSNETSKFESYSNVLCLDIDAPKPNEPKNGNEWIPDNLEALKRALGKIPYIAYCGLSAGGRGLFALIPIADHEHHKDYWEQLKTMFLDKFKIKIDAATHNIGRLRYMSYDDTAIINHNAAVFDKMPERFQEKRVQPERTKLFINPARYESRNDTEERIIKAVNEIVSRGIDITQNYDEWIKASAAIAHEMGERGRSIFHTIAQQYPDYDERKNDKLYTSIMGRAQGAECSINSFFHLCKLHGVDISHHVQRAPMFSKNSGEIAVKAQHPAKPQQLEEHPEDEQPPPSMSKAEWQDLKRHESEINKASKFLIDAKVQHPAIDMLFKTFGLELAGCNGWRMTDAQFNHINKQHP